MDARAAASVASAAVVAASAALNPALRKLEYAAMLFLISVLCFPRLSKASCIGLLEPPPPPPLPEADSFLASASLLNAIKADRSLIIP